jgi:hypothetical protein
MNVYAEVAKQSSSELLINAFFEIIFAWENSIEFTEENVNDIFESCKVELVKRKLITYH